MRSPISPETPEDRLSLRLGKPKKLAAGIPAAVSSMKHGVTKMGLVKTVKTLTMVNQQDGFDCPGCAWPDPEHRTTFEFCENGAKAVAVSLWQKRAIIGSISKDEFRTRWCLRKEHRITRKFLGIMHLTELHNNSNPYQNQNAPFFTHREEHPMKQLFFTKHLFVHWGPIICQIAPTCVMNQVGKGLVKPLV